jgi:hypothetical protein
VVVKKEGLTHHLLEECNTLPNEAVEDAASFVDSQRVKVNQAASDKPRHPVALGGIWKGIRINEEDIAVARRDMWAGVGDDEP